MDKASSLETYIKMIHQSIDELRLELRTSEGELTDLKKLAFDLADKRRELELCFSECISEGHTFKAENLLSYSAGIKEVDEEIHVVYNKRHNIERDIKLTMDALQTKRSEAKALAKLVESRKKNGESQRLKREWLAMDDRYLGLRLSR